VQILSGQRLLFDFAAMRLSSESH